MAGVDLTKVDGFQEQLVLGLLSETGVDMSPWKSEEHFASWLALCPGNKVSGGKRLSGRTRRSSNRAAHMFRLAAQAIHHSKSALGAYYRRMRYRLGPPKAITATAHKLARIYYRMLKYKKEYTDIGAEHYEGQYKKKVLEGLKRKAKEFGFNLVPMPDLAAVVPA